MFLVIIILANSFSKEEERGVMKQGVNLKVMGSMGVARIFQRGVTLIHT